MKKLNLGRELSKNDQKKILGGKTLVCFNVSAGGHTEHNWFGLCSDTSGMNAYCVGVGGAGSFVCNCF